MEVVVHGDVEIVVSTDPMDPARKPPLRRPLWAPALLLAAAFLVASVAVAGLGWMGWHDAAREPVAAFRTLARPNPFATVPPIPAAGLAPFAALRPVGPPLPMGGSGGDQLVGALTSIVDGRGIVAGRAKTGTLWVAGMDLATGRAAWPAVNLGQWDDFLGLYAVPQGVFVLGAHRDGPRPHFVVMVVDPATGRLRWQFGADAGVLEPYRDGLVVGDLANKQIVGLDWQTGTPRWKAALSTDAFYLSVSPNDGPTAPLLREPISVPADNRLIEVDLDGTVVTYDASTGVRLNARAQALPAGLGYPLVSYQAFGNMLYQVRHDGIEQVNVFDLSTAGRVRTLYTAPTGAHVGDLAPCGPGLICLDTINANDRRELVQIDLATGQERWRRLTAPGVGIGSTGDRILAEGSYLYDVEGRPLSILPSSIAAWVSPNGMVWLLDFGADIFHVPAARVVVFGVSANTGLDINLGTLSNVTGGCAVDTRTLVCPLDTGLQAWRFTNN